MKEIWFKRKKYGFGWVPCTWQGWFVIALYLLVVFGNIARIDKSSHSVSDTLLNILPVEIVATALLIAVCYAMGEEPKWSWGEKKLGAKKELTVNKQQKKKSSPKKRNSKR
jgi:hypothetical protein